MTKQESSVQGDGAIFVKKMMEATGLSEAEIKRYYQMARQGCSIAEMLNIPQESLDAGYALAYNLYNLEQYDDAETMFRALCQYESANLKNWLGLGACLMQKSSFIEAALCYAHAADINSAMNAKPIFLLARCLTTLNDYVAARNVLQVVVQSEYTDSEQKQYQSRAKELLESLPKE